MTSNQIDHLVDQELRHGDRRSSEYRAGAIAVLSFKELGIRIPQPYMPGTSQADAYWSGFDRGWAIWHKLHDGCKAPTGKAMAQ